MTICLRIIFMNNDDDPVYIKNYRLPQAHKHEIHEQVQNMLNQNIIEPSNSPYNSPILLVPKKSTDDKPKWRLVVDYRQLNTKLIPDKFPLPRVDETLDSLGSAKYFSTLDLRSGFHQIPLAQDSRRYAEFSTDSGHYQPTRLPFGLNVGPNSFQRIMNIALSGLPPDTCFLYIDDIVVIGKSDTDHLRNLRALFDRLRTRSLKLNPNKCVFFRRDLLTTKNKIQYHHSTSS